MSGRMQQTALMQVPYRSTSTYSYSFGPGPLQLWRVGAWL